MTSIDIPIGVTPDMINEETETFTIMLTSQGNGVLPGPLTTATVSIMDDDGKPLCSFVSLLVSLLNTNIVKSFFLQGVG